MSTVGWLFNYVPWWLPYVIGAVALVATMPYWTPVWAMLPKPVKIGLGALGAGIGLWWMGRNQGAKSERNQQEKRDARGEEQRQEIHRDIEKLDRPAVDKRLDPYYRD